ncbi:acyltransferase [Cohnella sp. GCM10027633]|uniref:acyltransferase n=1 Tax=unclassified Cohnella TaxID=2636738 RepID=UPI003631CF5B
MKAPSPPALAPNLNAIDAMRFVAVILVLCIHTDALKSIDETLNFGLVNVLARIAVPFFFMAAGYFLYDKISKHPKSVDRASSGHLMRYVKRIAGIYLFWSLVYFPYDFRGKYEVNDHRLWPSISDYIGNFFLQGGHFHLWYLPALIYATLLLYGASRLFSLRTVVSISFGIYVVGLFGNSYYGFVAGDASIANAYARYAELFGDTRNGLFFGFLYVSVGAFIRASRSTISLSMASLAFALSMLGLAAEAFLLQRFSAPLDYDMTLFLLPASYFLFRCLLVLRISTPNVDFKLLRDASLLMYCCHGIFLEVYRRLFSLLDLDGRLLSDLALFVLVFACSFACSFVLIKLRRNEKYGKVATLAY